MPSGKIRVDVDAHTEGESAARFQAEVEAGTRAALDQAGRELVMVAVAGATHDTGFMRSQIQAEVQGADAVELSLSGPAYFEAQEAGSEAHLIGAPGQNLYNAEDQFEATGPVTHPGTPARGFLAAAWRAVGARFTGIWSRYLP